MEVTDYIPRENFNLWYGLFKQYQGRLLCNPICGKRVYVKYTFKDAENYTILQQEFERLTTPIIETKSGLFKRLKRRFFGK